MNWVLGTNRESKGVEGFQGRGPTLEAHICSTKDFVAGRGDTEMFNGKSPVISSAVQGQPEAVRRDGSGTGGSLEGPGVIRAKESEAPQEAWPRSCSEKGESQDLSPGPQVPS